LRVERIDGPIWVDDGSSLIYGSAVAMRIPRTSARGHKATLIRCVVVTVRLQFRLASGHSKDAENQRLVMPSERFVR
jgi:hypothetical protein